MKQTAYLSDVEPTPPKPVKPSREPGTFTDANGHLWNLAITLKKAREIERVDFSKQTKMKVSLVEPEKDLWTELYNRLGLRLAVIYYLVRDQVLKQLGIDPFLNDQANQDAEDAFCEGIDGKTKDTSLLALHEALVDFFPEQATGLNLTQANSVKARRLVEEQIPTIAPHLDALMTRTITDSYQKIGEVLSKGSPEEVQATLTAEYGRISKLSQLPQTSVEPSPINSPSEK